MLGAPDFTMEDEEDLAPEKVKSAVYIMLSLKTSIGYSSHTRSTGVITSHNLAIFSLSSFLKHICIISMKRKSYIIPYI